jgi:hypothetical protein
MGEMTLARLQCLRLRIPANGKTGFSLAGDELSMQQIADAFSRVIARDVRYVQVSWDQFEKNMGSELTVMSHWFEQKGFHFNIERVRREYPLTRTFNRWPEAYWNTTAVAAH